MVLMAHVGGLPVEETLPYLVPVLGTMAVAAGAVLQAAVRRWRGRREERTSGRVSGGGLL
jgi:hypothetical protein